MDGRWASLQRRSARCLVPEGAAQSEQGSNVALSGRRIDDSEERATADSSPEAARPRRSIVAVRPSANRAGRSVRGFPRCEFLVG